jgi:hypothetical protein
MSLHKTARNDAEPALAAGHLGNDRQLPPRQKLGMSGAMEELFGDPSYKGFVLQDKKRLPARFFARISGALLSRLC